MYVFHLNIEDAHAWEHMNPEWKPVSFCVGHVTGSILVLYELVPKVIEVPVVEKSNRITLEPSQSDCLCAHAINNWDGMTHDKRCQYYRAPLEPPKRGRPPKVRQSA